MNVELAKAVVNEAISGGYLDETPATEEEILEQGTYFAKEAELAYNEGWGKGNESITAIVKLLISSEEVDKSIPDQFVPEHQTDKESGSTSSAFFNDLPRPHIHEGISSVQMPYDVSVIDDIDVRRYHGIFNHFYARARYALAEEEAALLTAKRLKEDALRKAMQKVDKFYEGTEKQKPATVLSAEAALDNDYMVFEKVAGEHEEAVIKLKALSDIYSKNVEVLSREATLRQNEFERSR